MKHEIVMYMAERKMNDVMSSVDMRPDYKWFVRPTKLWFETTTEVNDAYFRGVIEKSKQDKDVWVPAISYGDKFYRDPSVKIISDGEREYFVQELDKEAASVSTN